jgi:hypothetical protein
MDHKIIHKFSTNDAAKLRLSGFVEITDGDTELSVHLGQEQVLAAVCEYVTDSRWAGNGKERLESISKAIDETRAKLADALSWEPIATTKRRHWRLLPVSARTTDKRTVHTVAITGWDDPLPFNLYYFTPWIIT